MQQAGKFFIEGMNVCDDINHENEHSGFFDGNMDLFANGGFKLVFGVWHKSTGIDNGKFNAIPVAAAIMAVARYTAEIINDGFTFTG